MEHEIGTTAGEVWKCLHDHGEMSFSSLEKNLGSKRELVFAAIGWLAREGKLSFQRGKRRTLVSLR